MDALGAKNNKKMENRRFLCFDYIRRSLQLIRIVWLIHAMQRLLLLFSSMCVVDSNIFRTNLMFLIFYEHRHMHRSERSTRNGGVTMAKRNL